jgi:hypothetical protein
LSEYIAKKETKPNNRTSKAISKRAGDTNKERTNTKSVGRKQINKPLYDNLNKQDAPVNITH